MKPEEHHEHHYIGDEKQPPIVTYGPVNAAMSTALNRIVRSWQSMAERWDESR